MHRHITISVNVGKKQTSYKKTYVHAFLRNYCSDDED
jgi:hypothetical protein